MVALLSQLYCGPYSSWEKWSDQTSLWWFCLWAIARISKEILLVKILQFNTRGKLWLWRQCSTPKKRCQDLMVCQRVIAREYTNVSKDMKGKYLDPFKRLLDVVEFGGTLVHLVGSIFKRTLVAYKYLVSTL